MSRSKDFMKISFNYPPIRPALAVHPEISIYIFGRISSNAKTSFVLSTLHHCLCLHVSERQVSVKPRCRVRWCVGSPTASPTFVCRWLSEILWWNWGFSADAQWVSSPTRLRHGLRHSVCQKRRRWWSEGQRDRYIDPARWTNVPVPLTLKKAVPNRDDYNRILRFYTDL